jgi:hypothetical protein
VVLEAPSMVLLLPTCTKAKTIPPIYAITRIRWRRLQSADWGEVYLQSKEFTSDSEGTGRSCKIPEQRLPLSDLDVRKIMVVEVWVLNKYSFSLYHSCD